MKKMLLGSLAFMATTGNVRGDRYSPLLGPVFPKPSIISQSTVFQNLADNFTATLQAGIAKKSIIDSENTSFALQVFSTNTEDPLFDYYYTSPETKNASSGVHEVDENTVFRIGSVSKLWTIYLYLVSVGDSTFNDPVTEWVPELRCEAIKQMENVTARDDTVDFVRWEEVTLKELASQLAGIGRDYAFSDLSTYDPTLVKEGFPTLSKSEIPPCGLTGPCNRSQFFEGITKTHPTAPISFTPIYSNAAFQIFSYALEAIAGQNYVDLLHEYLLEPLNLKQSFYSVPADSIGIIPGSVASSLWSLNPGDETPAGGLYSSIKDMSSIGRAILSNTLLCPVTTRRWMKPVTHTASMRYSVGAPWEIYSFKNDDRRIDLYTKAGDLGAYSAGFALLPDYNVGINILAAGSGTTSLTAVLGDMISELLIPSLEQVARDEANATFAGFYSSKSSETNSSLVIGMDDGPGLRVSKWVSDDKDMIQVVTALSGINDLTIRLYPTGLEDVSGDKRQVSFRAVFGEPISSQTSIGPMTGSSISWELADAYLYGNVGLDEFLFELDAATGKVVSVSPRALRETLAKN